jgi:integrase
LGLYLQEKVVYYVEHERSRQTFETLIAGLGKFQYALNNCIDKYSLDIIPLDTKKIRHEFYAKGKKLLSISSRKFDSRAYPDPLLLIQNIQDGTYQLQACLQLEGGLRAEGVGSPRNKRLRNPLTRKGLLGIIPDPITGKPVGCVSAIEKGGKQTNHYISSETYNRLEEYIRSFGQLESDYSKYVGAINNAARKTGQFFVGRGSHGFKHNFARRRYAECVMHGLSHEEALQMTSLETSHFRMTETLTYTKGRIK